MSIKSWLKTGWAASSRPTAAEKALAVSRRKVRSGRNEPWYAAVREELQKELQEAKKERRRAESQ
jgi:hypothetical protein